jgi:hypothetical protein
MFLKLEVATIVCRLSRSPQGCAMSKIAVVIAYITLNSFVLFYNVW